MTIAAAAPAMYTRLFAALAAAAVYTPAAGGEPVETRVKVDRGMLAVGDFAQATQTSILLSLPVADVPRPRSGDTVVVEGEGSFTVERREQSNGYKVIVSAREVPA